MMHRTGIFGSTMLGTAILAAQTISVNSRRTQNDFGSAETHADGSVDSGEHASPQIPGTVHEGGSQQTVYAVFFIMVDMFIGDLADELHVSKIALLILFVGIALALGWVMVPCLCRFATGTGVIEQKVQKVTREMQVVETQLERIEDRQQSFETRVDEQFQSQSAQLSQITEGLGQVLSKAYEQSNKLDKLSTPAVAQAQSQTQGSSHQPRRPGGSWGFLS